MNKNIIRFAKRIAALFFLGLPCLCRAQSKTPEWVYIEPEKTINGIRYFEKTMIINEVIDYPTLTYFRHYGFSLNPDDHNTYIAPDGKIIPAFYCALHVMPLNADNATIHPPVGTPSSYSGEIYIPDMIEDWRPERNYYVIGFSPRAMGEELISIRMPLYSMIDTNNFQKAVNLQKIQIGSCYAVGKCGFWYCKKLESVIIEQTPYIYEFAFAGATGIKEIVLQSETELPYIESDTAFEDCVYKNATLYIPANLMEACHKDPVWGKFVRKRTLNNCPVEFVKP